MTEADEVRQLAYDVADNARKANIALSQANQAIQDMQRGILLLDLTSESSHVRTVARYGIGAGSNISSDIEVLLMVESEMKQWMHKL